MSEPVRGRGRGGEGRGRGRGRGGGHGRGGDGEEREKWTDREKEIIRKMLAYGTDFFNKLKEMALVMPNIKFGKISLQSSVINLDGRL